MGIFLVTICTDEMLSDRLCEYLRSHWSGPPCDSYVSGHHADVLEGMWNEMRYGDFALILCESCLLGDVRRAVEVGQRQHGLREDSVRIGELLEGEFPAGCGAETGALLYGPLQQVLDMAQTLALDCIHPTGTIAVIYPAGRASALLRTTSLATMVRPLGRTVAVVSTDEYGLGCSDADMSVMRMLCHARMGQLGRLEDYMIDNQGISVADAEGCGPELYELTSEEALALSNMLCSSGKCVVMAVLGSGATALNLHILDCCDRILCVGGWQAMERTLVRFFGERVVQIYAKTTEISIDEIKEYVANEDWGRLWARI